MENKRSFRNIFKKFGGEQIPDVISYLKDYLANDEYATITIGCDSVQSRSNTIFAITIAIYNSSIRNGAHVIFFRDYHDKIKTSDERLDKEVQYVYDLAMFLTEELHDYQRKDLSDYERKRYKHHLKRCDEEYSMDGYSEDYNVIHNMILTDSDKAMDYKLVDIHVDFNPSPGNPQKPNNKSYKAYKKNVSWLRAMGFRTWAKPCAWASTSAADLLLK